MINILKTFIFNNRYKFLKRYLYCNNGGLEPRQRICNRNLRHVSNGRRPRVYMILFILYGLGMLSVQTAVFECICWFISNRDRKGQSYPVEYYLESVEEYLGSIASCCSGNEPALLPRRHGWTREASFVSLNQSDNHPQIFVWHKLSRQFGLRDDNSCWQTMWNW